MSQVVNRLTAGGYAVRGRDPEGGRRVLFTATPEGLAIATAVANRRDSWFNARLDEFNAGERLVLARAAGILRRIADF